MVINYSLGFTIFELAEFIALSSKYTKTLYRLLKQYRSTGELYIEWQEFVKVMGIPKSYTQMDIDKQILKPAIKELKQELKLFDNKRIPFKELKYQKIKAGVGNKIIAITFNFEKSNEEYQPFRYKETPLIETKEQNYLNQFIGKYMLNEEYKKMEILNLRRIYEEGLLSLEVSVEDTQTNETMSKNFSFKNELELKQLVKKFCKNEEEIDAIRAERQKSYGLVKQTFQRI